MWVLSTRRKKSLPHRSWTGFHKCSILLSMCYSLLCASVWKKEQADVKPLKDRPFKPVCARALHFSLGHLSQTRIHTRHTFRSITSKPYYTSLPLTLKNHRLVLNGKNACAHTYLIWGNGCHWHQHTPGARWHHTSFHSRTKRARQDGICWLILNFISILGQEICAMYFKRTKHYQANSKKKKEKYFLLKAHTYSGTMPLPNSKHRHFIRQTHSNSSHFAYSVPLSCSMSFCSLLIMALNGAFLMVKDQGF